MMWTDWTPIQSSGLIPESLLPCQAWQARWFLEWDYEIRDASRLGDTCLGEWHWNIAVPGQEFFASKSKVRISLAWFSYGVGGLAEVAWWWDGSGDRVLTETPTWASRPVRNGSPVWAGDEAQFDLPLWSASNPAATGTEQPYLNPGGGDDTAQNTIFIQTWWEGPVYEIPLPVGATWTVPFHNVGATWLIKLANLQMRTLKGGDIGGMVDVAGILRVGGMNGNNTVQRVYHHNATVREDRLITTNLRSPQLAKLADNTLLCLGEHGGIWQLRRSQNDGITWEVVRDMWAPGYQNARFIVLPDGASLHIATKGTMAYAMRSDSTIAPTSIAAGVVAPCSLQYDARLGAVLVDAEGNTWRSRDGGLSWEAGQ